MIDDEYPCDSCDLHCDYWEAKYCCTLCHWYSDNPDCEDCNPMDIQVGRLLYYENIISFTRLPRGR